MSINKALMLRNKHNLLQREVAELVGCSMYSVSRAERGGSPVVYDKILKVLGGDKIEPNVTPAPRKAPTPDKLLSARWIDTKTNWRARYDKKGVAA